MTKHFFIYSIFSLAFLYQPVQREEILGDSFSPVSVYYPPTETKAPIARLIAVNGTLVNDKIIIDWVVEDNPLVDQFEVEKSTDGKNFTIAAIVFGSEEPVTGTYQYFEKASRRKIIYRIKMIAKNKEAQYSRVIEINKSTTSLTLKPTKHGKYC
jgi:hypothetical protein